MGVKRKRIRIDLEDDDGTKYDIKVEGSVTREKVLKIFEVMEMMNIEDDAAGAPSLGSVGQMIWYVVGKEYPVGRFTSTAVLEKYEDEYNRPIKLSVISTYLARFAQKGRLERVKAGREWSYSIVPGAPPMAVAGQVQGLSM